MSFSGADIAETEAWLKQQLQSSSSPKATLDATISNMEDAMLELGSGKTLRREDLDVDLISRARAATQHINDAFGDNSSSRNDLGAMGPNSSVNGVQTSRRSLRVDTSPSGSRGGGQPTQKFPNDGRGTSGENNAVAALEEQVAQLAKQVQSVRNQESDALLTKQVLASDNSNSAFSGAESNRRDVLVGTNDREVERLQQKLAALEKENAKMRKEMQPLPGFFKEIETLKQDYLKAKQQNRRLDKQCRHLSRKLKAGVRSRVRWRPGAWTGLATQLRANDLLDEGAVRKSIFERGLKQHLGFHSSEVRQIIESMQISRPLGGQRHSSELVDYVPFLRIAKLLGAFPSKNGSGQNADEADLELQEFDGDLGLDKRGNRRRRSRSLDPGRQRSSPRGRKSYRDTDNLYSSRRLDEFSSKYGQGLYGSEEEDDVIEPPSGSSLLDGLSSMKLYSLSDVERKLERAYRERIWHGIDLQKVEDLLKTENAREEHRPGVLTPSRARKLASPAAKLSRRTDSYLVAKDKARKTTTYEVMSRVVKKIIARRLLPLSPSDGEVLLRGLHNATKTKAGRSGVKLSATQRAAQAHLVDAAVLLDIIEAFPLRSRYAEQPNARSSPLRHHREAFDDSRRRYHRRSGDVAATSPHLSPRQRQRRRSLLDDGYKPPRRSRYLSDSDDEIYNNDGFESPRYSDQRLSPRSVHNSPRRRRQATVALSPKATSPSNRKPWGAPPRRYKVGDEVEAQYMGGLRWFRGRVMGRNGDGTFDILYKDGDREQRVRQMHMRPWTVTSAASASASNSPVAQQRHRRQSASSVTSQSLRKTVTTRAARRASGSSFAGADDDDGDFSDDDRVRSSRSPLMRGSSSSRHGSPHHGSSPRRGTPHNGSPRSRSLGELQARVAQAFGGAISRLKLKFEIHDLTDVKTIPKMEFVKALRSVAPDFPSSDLQRVTEKFRSKKNRTKIAYAAFLRFAGYR